MKKFTLFKNLQKGSAVLGIIVFSLIATAVAAIVVSSVKNLDIRNKAATVATPAPSWYSFGTQTPVKDCNTLCATIGGQCTMSCPSTRNDIKTTVTVISALRFRCYDSVTHQYLTGCAGEGSELSCDVLPKDYGPGIVYEEDCCCQNVPTPTPVPTALPPVLDMRFDEGSGSVVYDTSSEHNNGTIVNNAVWQTGSQCKSGNCLSFNGSSQYVEIPTSSVKNSLWLAGPFTIEAWIKRADSGSGAQVIVGKQENDYVMELYQSKVRGTVYSDSSWAVGSQSINDSNWRHTAFTYDPNSGKIAKIYVDGVEVYSGVQSTWMFHNTVQNAKVFIGTRLYGVRPDFFFHGSIDEVKIWKRVLSAYEICQKGCITNSNSTPRSTPRPAATATSKPVFSPTPRLVPTPVPTIQNRVNMNVSFISESYRILGLTFGYRGRIKWTNPVNAKNIVSKYRIERIKLSTGKVLVNKIVYPNGSSNTQQYYDYGLAKGTDYTYRFCVTPKGKSEVCTTPPVKVTGGKSSTTSKTLSFTVITS